MRIFVSYAHKQGDWVHDSLVPILRASGAEVLVDVDRFTAGKAVIGQMDDLQRKAHRHVLVITHDYAASEYCRHEMMQAIAVDPDFSNGKVIAIRRDDELLPSELAGAADLGSGPLYVDLRDERLDSSWGLLIKSCDLSFHGVSAPTWLRARDDALRHLNRGESVNLVCQDERLILTKEILNEILERHKEIFVDIDFSSPLTHTRRGFVKTISKSIGVSSDVPAEPEDLMFLHSILEERNDITHLCLRNFDMLFTRKKRYDVNDFLSTLRHWVMDKRFLVLLVQSSAPYGSHLDHFLIDQNVSMTDFRVVYALKLVELK